MKDYEVTYYECFSKVYDVKAETAQEAEQSVFEDILAGHRLPPSECCNSFFITEESGLDLVLYEKEAEEFVNAIKEIASKEENLDNLKSYLSIHFMEWINKYVNTPENMVSELKEFASMEIKN